MLISCCLTQLLADVCYRVKQKARHKSIRLRYAADAYLDSLIEPDSEGVDTIQRHDRVSAGQHATQHLDGILDICTGDIKMCHSAQFRASQHTEAHASGFELSPKIWC